MSDMRLQFLYTQDTNTLVNNIIVLENINAERNDEITALRARAERAEKALKELVLATAYDMRHSEDENQIVAWGALENLKNALEKANSIIGKDGEE